MSSAPPLGYASVFSCPFVFFSTFSVSSLYLLSPFSHIPSRDTLFHFSILINFLPFVHRLAAAFLNLLRVKFLHRESFFESSLDSSLSP